MDNYALDARYGIYVKEHCGHVDDPGNVEFNEGLVHQLLGPKESYASEQAFIASSEEVRYLLGGSILPVELWVDPMMRESYAAILHNNNDLGMEAIFKHHGCDSTFYGKINSRIVGGPDSRIQGSLDDITEEVQQNESLEKLGFMFGVAAHEIRGDLFLAQAELDTLLYSYEDDPRIFAGIRKALHTIENLGKTCSATLDYAKNQDSYVLSRVRGDAILEQLTKRYEKLWREKPFSLRTMNTCDSYVLADTEKLSRVFINLIRNGSESMVEGPFFLTCSEVDGGIQYEVRDHGNGIPHEVIPIIFEPFATRGKKDGTGLGLPVCKSIVENHNGKIHCTSEVGEGTTFTVTLPKA